VSQREAKARRAVAGDVDDNVVRNVTAVPFDLRASDRQELVRWETVARKEAVHVRSGCVAWRTSVHDEHVSARARQHERRRQPCGATTDHDDIEVVHGSSFATTAVDGKKCCRFRECGLRVLLASGTHVDVLAVPPEQAQDLDGLVIRGAEPVRHLGVELGDLARPHRAVTLAEDQS
jgi:hypothetical protein